MIKEILLTMIIVSLLPIAFADDHRIPEQVESDPEPITEILPEPEPTREIEPETPRDLEIERLLDRINDLRYENIQLQKEIRSLNQTIDYLNDQISLVAKEMAYSFIQLNEWYKSQLIR